MLVAAAVAPCPPILPPELAQGAAGELDDLRAACDRAVAMLAGAKPDRIVVVGGGPADEVLDSGGTGSFAPYGADVEVRLGAGVGRLPLSLSVGAWLLARSSWTGPVAGRVLADDADPAHCAAVGRGLAAEGRTALLVMGDGSACRTEKAPGYLDPRAEAYDAALGQALANADSAALAELDPVTARELWVSGRPGWQALAGAAENSALTGRALYEEAPYGVGYFVSVWS